MSKKHYTDISFLIDAWAENVSVNLIDFQAILKSPVDFRKPPKEDLFSTTPQVKTVNSWIKCYMLNELKEEGREHKWIICRNTLFPLKTQTEKKKKKKTNLTTEFLDLEVILGKIGTISIC